MLIAYLTNISRETYNFATIILPAIHAIVNGHRKKIIQKEMT